MIQHRFSCELVARGRPPASSHWRLTFRDGDSLRIVAEISYHPDVYEWRLRSVLPGLPYSMATWSDRRRSIRPTTVPAWLQSEASAQLLVWAWDALDGRDDSALAEARRINARARELGGAA